MIPRATIETAYAFFHQKERVYAYSNMEWQKDDIDYAISQYVHDMDKQLLALLANGIPDFLESHLRFHQDLQAAVEQLESMLGI